MKIKQIAEWIKTALQQKLSYCDNYDVQVIKEREDKYIIKVTNVSAVSIFTGNALEEIAEVLGKAEKSMPCIINRLIQVEVGKPVYIVFIYEK